MNRGASIDRLIRDLQAVLADLEALLEAQQGGAQSSAAHDSLRRLRLRAQDLKMQLSEHVRDNAWRWLGVAAIFIAGLLMGRRPHESSRRSP